MKLKLNEIVDLPGESIFFKYDLDLTDQEIHFGKPFTDPIHVAGSITNNAGVLSLKAECDSSIQFECDRCARETRKKYGLKIEAVLVESLESPEDYDNSEIILIENTAVDVDEVVRSAVILESDMKWLCSEDCKGLCQKCGRNLNDGQCECEAPTDPRLDKLKQLLNRD